MAGELIKRGSNCYFAVAVASLNTREKTGKTEKTIEGKKMTVLKEFRVLRRWGFGELCSLKDVKSSQKWRRDFVRG